MTDAPRAIQACFSDWRTVKGRKMLQLVFEVPLEQQADVLTMLGAPMPDQQLWCGIAVLDPSTATASVSQTQSSNTDISPKQKRPLHTLPLSQQAGILAGDKEFQEWSLTVDPSVVRTMGGYGADEYIRDQCCDGKSRATLDEFKNRLRNPEYVIEYARRFQSMVERFRREVGREAEPR